MRIKDRILYSLFKAFIAKPFDLYLADAKKRLDQVKAAGGKSMYDVDSLAAVVRWTDYTLYPKKKLVQDLLRRKK